jgi:3-oxoacyl-[acyl-carrier protein] reductase
MAKVWALELGAHGITANPVGPGPIRTPCSTAQPAQQPRDGGHHRCYPVKRIGEPEDVANAVAFLLDARSGFVTGLVLYVCGGMTVGNANA